MLLLPIRIPLKQPLENWMIAISFWEVQTARRLFLLWKRHRLSIAATALAHWYGHSLKHCFLRWKTDAHRQENGAVNRPVPGDLAFGAGSQQPASVLHTRDGNGQSLRRSFPFPFACPAFASLILSLRLKMGGGPTPPRFPAFWHIFAHRRSRAQFPIAPERISKVEICKQPR